MRTWMLTIVVLLTGALALGACGGDSDNADENDDLSNGEDASGAVEYELTIGFDSETYEAGHDDDVMAVLRGYDDNPDAISQDSFPPTLFVTLASDVEDFCDAAQADLEATVVSVSQVTCEVAVEPGDGISDKPDDGDIGAACLEGTVDCVDTPDTCIGDDCPAIGEDPALPPPDDPASGSGPGEYQLRISFNETVQQDHIDETGAMIRDLAPDAEYVIQESFPPTGVATFVAETEDTCLALVPRLEEQTFVNAASCELRPQLEPGTDPDEPVTNDAN